MPFRFTAHKVLKLARPLCLLLLAAALVVPAGCGAVDPRDTRPVVTVGKRSLTADQLKIELKRLMPDVETVPEDKKRLTAVLVERLVDHCRILEYGRERGISVSEEEVEAAVSEIRRDYGQDFEEILLKRAIDLEEWKEGLREQILMRKIIEKALETVPAPTAEEIRAYYEAHAQEFKRPPSVKARQVILPTKKEAQELAAKLAKGGKTEELAAGGGEMGWVEQGELDERIDKVLFSLPIGRFSPVVETPYGFHIFQVTSKRVEGAPSLPEVAPEIERKLFSQKEEAFFSEWLKRLEEQFPMTINQELLEKLEWA
jgi:parvulin-like peptidyl-prolyl isomerase